MRIVVADDSEIIREGIQLVFGDQICAMVTNAADFVECVKTPTPGYGLADLGLIDVFLPRRAGEGPCDCGIETALQLHADADVSTRIAAISGNPQSSADYEKAVATGLPILDKHTLTSERLEALCGPG